MTKIIKPELSYNLVQVCREVGDFMEVVYNITNEDNETIRQFAEDQSDVAYAVWWSWLTKEERAIWEDYELQCEVASEMARENYYERMIGNY
jgi:hypothetical protein